MKGIRFAKIIVPEVVAYISDRQDGIVMEPDYRCVCGMGVAKEWECCPYCKAEFAWDKVKKPSKQFLQLVNRI